jgi:TRAP transporter TAXI family solute receptor
VSFANIDAEALFCPAALKPNRIIDFLMKILIGRSNLKLRMVLLIAIAIIAFAGPAPAQTIGLATSTPGSIYHSLGTSLAKVINEKAGVSTTVQPFSSPNVFIPAINSGELHLGLGNIYETTLAYEGQEYFSGRPNKDLRIVAITVPQRNAMFVKKDSNFRKIADVKGHRAPDGYSAQKILLPIYDAYYATAGFTRADMKPVNVPNVVAGADALAAGKADLFVFVVGGAKVREVDAAVGGLRALSIDNTPQNLAAIRKHFPVAYLKLEKPGPDNPGLVEPIYCLTYDGVLMTSSKTSDDLIYKVTKAMYENKPDLVAGYPVFKEFEPKDMVKNVPVPYHPGAIKFYKEKGMWPPKS